MLTREQIEKAVLETKTMSAAAAFLKVSDRTFKKYALQFDLYKPAKQANRKFKLVDVFSGLHPQYPTSKLSKRLVSEGYKIYQCEKCGIHEYMGEHISLELNHINGNKYDHSLKNLELLCPNCHSQTPTYRSKNLKIKK